MPPVRLTDRPTNKRRATAAPKVTIISADNHSNGNRFIKPRSAPRAEITQLREQLLDEFNHRLKNNLQILYGFLQSRGTKRTTRKLAKCSRIRAGASVQWGLRNGCFTPSAMQPT